MEYVDFKIFNF